MSVRVVLLAALIAAVGPWGAGAARAGIMTPAGLGPGDQFRVAFVSSEKHDALSSNIADYDAFITGLAAAAGIDTYFGSPVTWQVLGSTNSVSAISRVPLTSPPLYDMYGSKVADSGADLWDGTIDTAIFYDERGFGAVDEAVFTGTLPDGSASEFPLGGGPVPVTAYGLAFFVITNDLWITAGFDSSARSAQLYGVSSVLTVPSAAAVPVPAGLTLVLAGLAALAGGAAVRRHIRSEDGRH
jgi:hypothetical protein